MSNEVNWDDFEVVSEPETNWDEFEVVSTPEEVNWDEFEVVESEPVTQPKYKEDGSINHDSDYWKGKSAQEILREFEADKEAGHNFPSSYSNVTSKINGGEAEGVKSQEVTNEAAAATAEMGKEVIYQELLKDPEWEGKSEEELRKEASARYAEGAAETATSVLTLAVPFFQLGKGAATGKKVVDYGKKVANAAANGAVLGGAIEGAGEAGRVASGEEFDGTKSLEAVGEGGFWGALFGAGGQFAGDALVKTGKVASSGYDFVMNKEAKRALSELNEIGKSSKSAEKAASSTYFPEEIIDSINVTPNVKVGEVKEASSIASSHIKANEMKESPANVGVIRLAEAIDNKVIENLVEKSSARWEKTSRAVTGKNKNPVREKFAENIGFRDPNLKSSRKEASHQIKNQVNNMVDDLVDAPKAAPIMKDFQKSVNKLLSASDGRNADKFKKLYSKAMREANALSSIDKASSESMKKVLAEVKSYHNINRTSAVKEESKVLPYLFQTLGSVNTGYQLMQGDTSGAAMSLGGQLALGLAKGKINKTMNKHVAEQLREVDKAMRGDLGELKRRNKVFRDVEDWLSGKAKGVKSLPTIDGALVKAYLMMKEEEGR